jgi:hypothetical protein
VWLFIWPNINISKKHTVLVDLPLHDRPFENLRNAREPHVKRYQWKSFMTKAKFALCTPWRHVWGVDVCLHSFLTSELEGGELSASRLAALPTERSPRYPLNRSLCAPEPVGTFWRRSLAAAGIGTPDRSNTKPSRYSDCAIPALLSPFLVRVYLNIKATEMPW